MKSKEEEITCIICPLGCKILVRIKGLKVEHVKGNKCKQGIAYVKREALDPRRVLTTSVLVQNGTWPLVSVKSSHPIPKKDIVHVLDEIKKKTVNAPIQIGDLLIKNVANTGIDIVATKTVEIAT